MNKEGAMEDKKVSITDTDTMDTLIQKINSQTNVNAFFDEASGKISFSAKYTGNVGYEGIKLTGAFFSQIFDTPSVDPGQVAAGTLTFAFTNAGATLNGYTIEYGTVADGTTALANIDEVNKKIIINGDFTGTAFSTTVDVKGAIDKAFKDKGGSFFWDYCSCYRNS